MSTTDHAEGERRKDAALDLLAAHRAPYVLLARRALLSSVLCSGTATADDVRDAIELPPDVDPVALGCVPGPLAKAGIIERVGYVPTCRPMAHARPVSVWRLVDRPGAERWLARHPAPPPNGAAQRQTMLPLGA